MKIYEKWCDDQGQWDAAVNQFAGHPLQLWGWGAVKARHNWQAHRVLFYENEICIGGASIMIRPFPGPIPPLAYVSRGPFCDKSRRAEVVGKLTQVVKQRFKPLALSLEPEWYEFPSQRGWRKAQNTIIIPDTGIIDLQEGSEEIMRGMSKKTRQYINKSSKEALEVRAIKNQTELQECLAVYQETADRAGFQLHDHAYYEDIYKLGGKDNVLFGAWSKGKLVAFLWTLTSQTTAFELYGGVNTEGQRLRANYALKWQVIQACQERGVIHYDLNGLLNDGVSKFKRGFLKEEVSFVGTYDYPMSFWYTPYTRGLPLAKRLARLIAR